MAKIISERQRLEAFALYTMAANHYAKCREFEAAASEILGVTKGLEPYNDCVSDGIYGYEAGKSLAFDKVLEGAGVIIKKPKKSR